MTHPLRLRTRLLIAMLAPLLVAALALAIAGAWLVADVAERANDRVLAGALGAIAETVEVEDGQVTLDLPPAAFGMLENAERDNVYYRIAVGRELLTGYADLPAIDPARVPADIVTFRYGRYRDAPIRIAETVRRLPRIAQPVLVQVAETLSAREVLRTRLWRGLLFAEAVLVLAATLLLVPALGWSLRPLVVLRRAVERRTGDGPPDLSPLDTGPMPRELGPLATAFDRLLARLDTATAGVRRFTADASHQMRTPLSVLKVQVALARRGSDADRVEALGEIEEAVNRLERLLTQLLSLARAQEEGQSAPAETVDLHEVAGTVIARRIGQAIEADIDVRLDAETGPCHVTGHRTLIFELLGNLLDNAIRYNRRGGEVAIGLAARPDHVLLTVEDDGPGIPETDRARVFDRFVRLSPQAGRDGSGLGLAIVRSVAIRLGADVQLSDRPGGGLRATVRFERRLEG